MVTDEFSDPIGAVERLCIERAKALDRSVVVAFHALPDGRACHLDMDLDPKDWEADTDTFLKRYGYPMFNALRNYTFGRPGQQ